MTKSGAKPRSTSGIAFLLSASLITSILGFLLFSAPLSAQSLVAASTDFAIDLELTVVARGLESPVMVTSAQGDPRLFIVQQNGIISILENGELSDVLDLRDRVTFSNEAGLLGMALHPDFLSNGLAYVSFTQGNLESVIEQYRFDTKTGRFDLSSRRQVYSLAQPARNHNGGMIAFGPEGYLYAGFGDGGGANDTFANGQNLNSAHGSIIRIAVGPDVEAPFTIPPDNPRPSGPAAEIWVHGLRNPWRFSFDAGQIYIGDVGQSGEEEINVVAAGAASSGINFGWPLAEGNQCFSDYSCKNRDIVWPLVTYPTSAGCAITGGETYRGTSIKGLAGTYFYGDFCSGEIFSFRLENGVATDQRDWSDILGKIDFLAGFGLDGFGELYFASLSGTIYRLDPAS